MLVFDAVTSLLTEPAVIYPRSRSSLTSEYLRGGYDLCVNFTNPSVSCFYDVFLFDC